MGVSVLPFTAVAAEGAQHGGSITETGHGVESAESNASAAITDVTVDDSVSHADDIVFAWRSDRNGSEPSSYQVNVTVAGGVAADHELCLDAGNCERLADSDESQTVTVRNVTRSGDRATINATLRRVSDGTTVDDASVSVWWVDPDADLDRDGVSNEREVAAGSSLVQADTDGDGLSDEREIEVGSDPTVADTDGDGLSDNREVKLGTDPTETDTDGDGLSDAREVDVGTDPTAVDTDEDGLDDARELDLGANATVADTDGDGLEDGREVELGANLTTADTDGDGLEDGREADVGSDPTVADTDDDGLDDAREVELGTDPTAADSDDDGLADAREVELGTDPTAADTDDDGLADGRELGIGSDPTVADTDDDGLDDGRETELGTDPTVRDTDGDYIADGTEQELGFDPTNTYTPALYGSGLIGFLLGIGVALSTIERSPTEWVRAAVPSGFSRSVETPAQAGAVPAEPADRTPSDVEATDGDAASARDVFERHQDALVTDDERTLRMLEAEGGQMKQSAIVEATSWSKAKVSRLLSRMDDEGDIVKVTIGRENLICLPDHTPKPAQPTDPGAVRSGRIVGSATSG